MDIWRRNTALSAPTKMDIGVQATDCEECYSLSLAAGGSTNYGGLRCEQVDDLLCWVTQLQDEVMEQHEREWPAWS